MKPTKAYIAMIDVKTVVKRWQDLQVSDLRALEEIQQICTRFQFEQCVNELEQMFLLQNVNMN